ncbi:MAG: MmgE/PrpD family protein, partial [Betaproteobacteria bacterium]|nr:MmgE/PrpD family protein [Betaproteobacteria bacterium]
MTDAIAVTRTLARYVVNARYDDIPGDVRHEARRALLNWLGCAIGAAHHETVDRALAALAPFAGAPQATLLGRSERLDILNTAFLNGVSSHVLDFDDTHEKAIHPSAPVYPALLALGEWRNASGADFLHAFILGVEVECRLALAVFPEHYDVGWHVTGTAGVFGAAAAAGKLLGLSVQQMTWALGIAATQSAGLREMFGSMCKSFHPGAAARNGLCAALLAARNFDSSERGVEAPRGWAHVLSTRFDPAIITAGLGEHFELSRNMYKPYPCGLVVHAVIDGCIELRRRHDLNPAEIERVELRVNPIVLELTGKKTPNTGLEGKFSVYHAAAIGLLYGRANESEYADAVVRNPEVIAMRDRVNATVDPAVKSPLEAYVGIKLCDGRVLEHHVPHALGTLARPMSDNDLEAKFRALVAPVLPGDRVGELIALSWDAERLRDVD